MSAATIDRHEDMARIMVAPRWVPKMQPQSPLSGALRPSYCQNFGGLGLLLLGPASAAEHVGVTVVDFQRQRVDGHRVDPAALGAPPVHVGVPRSVLAAVLARVLVGGERILHRLPSPPPPPPLPSLPPE